MDPTRRDRLLCLENIGKRFGRTEALSRIFFDLYAGERLAVLGRNGAGKSTLLSIVAGLDAQDEGRLEFFGSERHGVNRMRHFGIVFQQSTLDLELSVRHNLMFHGGLHGLAPEVARQRCEDLLTRFDLAASARRRAGELSGGNRRRVELARALMHRPRVLLMDEPTVGLDPGSRRALLSDIDDLKRDHGLGVIWATHLIDEAEQADRVILLDRGKLIFDGSPALMKTRGGQTLSDAFFHLSQEVEA